MSDLIRTSLLRTEQSPTERIRRCAAHLVEIEFRKSMSRMASYEVVGMSVGASGSWIRKFVNGSVECALSYPVGWNIEELYARLCDRIEGAADARNQRAEALEHEIAARTIEMDSCLAPVGQGEAGEELT